MNKQILVVNKKENMMCTLSCNGLYPSFNVQKMSANTSDTFSIHNINGDRLLYRSVTLENHEKYRKMLNTIIYFVYCNFVTKDANDCRVIDYGDLKVEIAINDTFYVYKPEKDEFFEWKS
jgi:hypothetical protein